MATFSVVDEFEEMSLFAPRKSVPTQPFYGLDAISCTIFNVRGSKGHALNDGVPPQAEDKTCHKVPHILSSTRSMCLHRHGDFEICGTTRQMKCMSCGYVLSCGLRVTEDSKFSNSNRGGVVIPVPYDAQLMSANPFWLAFCIFTTNVRMLASAKGALQDKYHTLATRRHRDVFLSRPIDLYQRKERMGKPH